MNTAESGKVNQYSHRLDPTLLRVNGMPDLLDRNASVLLLDAGTTVVVGHRNQLSFHKLRRSEGTREAEQSGFHKIEGQIINVTSYGSHSVIVTSSRTDRTYLQVADAKSLRDLISFPGRATEVEVVGHTIFASLNATVERPPSLIAVHAGTGAIMMTQDLPSGDVTLAAAPKFNSVMISDRRSQTVRIFSNKMECDLSLEPSTNHPLSPNSSSLPYSESQCRSCSETKDSVKQLRPSANPRPRHPSSADRRFGTSWILEECDEWVAKGSVVARNSLCHQEKPCKQRLDFAISKLIRTGKHLLAANALGRDLVLMDGHNLRILHVHSFGRDGATLATSHDAKIILAYRWVSRSWLALDIDAVVENLPPLDRSGSTPAESITFYGHNPEDLPTLPSPKLGPFRVIALPVVEPGQDFGDPDVSRFGAFMHPNSFDVIHRYYNEVSSGQVSPGLIDMQIELFGSDVGPSGRPLLMPASFKSYFYPAFIRGGLVASVTTGASPYNVALDGTEQLTLHVVPREEPEQDLTVPFYTIGFSTLHDPFPVTLVFDGSGAAQWQVVDSAGRTWNLSLNFPPHTIDIEAADVDAGLTELRTYLISVLHNAEAAANVPPGTHLFDIEVRRVKRAGADFGNLDINFRHVGGPGVIPAIVNIVTQSNLTLLGFDNPITGQFSFGTDQGRLQSYLTRAIREAEADAGYDFNNSLIRSVSVTFVTGVLTINIMMSDDDGGGSETQNAFISVLDVWKLDSLGFNAATPVFGETNVNDQNTLRDDFKLVHDAFTAAIDRLGGGGGAVAFLEQYSAVLIAIVGAPPAGEWNAGQPDVAGLRMFQVDMTAQHNSNDSIQLRRPYIGTILDATPDNTTMAHELGHALELPDLYHEDGYRDDLRYMGNWDIMNFHQNLPHLCAYHKYALGWIRPERIEPVPKPEPTGPTSRESLLVPVEYWDDGMEAAVHSTFGNTMPVRQAMHIDLGGDGHMQFDVVEARQKGIEFSQFLPASGAVLVYNAIDINDDSRYVENHLYRRKIHLLNTGFDLANAGDVFDLAAAPELSAVGVKVSIIDKRPVLRPYGTVNVFHVRVDREQAAFVDLCFTEASPVWKCPDIWVDWSGDNPSPTDDPDNHHQYPEGEPSGQGEKVRYPSSGTELHWVVARVYNMGTAEAKNVKINARRYLAGAGDTTNPPIFRSETVEEVPAGGFVTIPLRWDVRREDKVHQCLRCDIADWELPTDPPGVIALASDDVWLSNNFGQKNVTQFVALGGSPYEPISFQYSVTNDGIDSERAFLEPEGLPLGMKLTVSPRLRVIAPKETAIFNCTLELDANVIGDPHCTNDREFLLVTWRVAHDSPERWGACKYQN